MISNQLYSSWWLVRDRLIQNIWVTAIFFIGCMFTLPIQAVLIIERYSEGIEKRHINIDELSHYILDIVGQGNSYLKLNIILTAILMGWAFFSYLHSKKQVDYYHSLPISRGRMFLNNFIAGNISFFFIYIANLTLSMAIIAFMGFASSLEYMEIIKTVFVNIVFFNLIFSISILAGIITGTRLTHVLMTGVLLEYMQLFVVLSSEYFAYFFKTFYSDIIFTDRLIVLLSPISNYFNDFSYGTIVGPSMIMLVIILINIYIFTIRPSETSGKSLLNQRLKEITKYMVLLLGSMASGLIFYEVGQGQNWMIFGFFFGCIIGHCILESLLDFNMKNIFSNKRKLMIFMISAILLYAFMDMDLLGYDKRVPELGNIESVSIDPVNFDEYATYYDNASDISDMKDADKKLDKIRLSNPESIKAIFKISKLSISNQELSDDEFDKYLDIVVKFNLKDGKNMVRSYKYAPMEESLPLFASIFDTQEFKYRYYPVLNLKSENIAKTTIEFPGYTANDKEQSSSLEILKEERICRILEAVQNDFLKIKSKDLKRNNPIGIMTFYEKNESKKRADLPQNKDETNGNVIEVPIFKEYEETLKILSAYGCNKNMELSSDLIAYVKMYTYEEKNETDYNADGNPNNDEVKIIDSESEIEAFLDEYVLNFNLNLNSFIWADPNKWATVYLKNDGKSGYDFTFVKEVNIG